MQDTTTVIQALYTAFNRRDIDTVFRFMTADIDWPKASEGGRVIGKDAVRDYWTRQWTTFDPQVTPEEITPQPAGTISVKVHQVVRDREGVTLMDGTVWHLYTFAGGLIQRMDIAEGGPDWHA